MNREETIKVCFIIQAAYPQHYSGFSDRERKAMQEVWMSVMEDYDYRVVCAGVKAFIANDVKGFPPSPGQIIDSIHRLTERPENRLNEGEAWHMVYRALCNGIYHAEDEFNRLPPVVQRAVGAPGVLRQWAQDDAQSLAVIQSNFERAFRTAQQREKEEAKLPESVKRFIEQTLDVRLLKDNDSGE